MKKKTVLFINHSVRDGGPGRSLLYILKYIDRDRITPFVLIPKHDIFSENLREEGIFENVIIDPRFPENLQKSSLVSDFPLPPALVKALSVVVNTAQMVRLLFGSRKLLSENKIDVVYCNGTLAKILGAFIGKKNRVAVIWHVRNIQENRFLAFLMKSLSRSECVKKIICVSRAASGQFRDAENRVHVVYNGIDPSDFSRESVNGSLRDDLSLSSDTILIGNTGRVVPRKGYMNFVNIACRMLSDLNIRDRLKFVIVGDTPWFFPKNHLRELKEYVEKCGVDDSFIFTGYRKDVRPYLKDFDIFVIPSNYPDPFPRSVIEAMAFGLPVVGFAAGGISEAVEHGKTGFLCERDNFSQMEDSITELVLDEKKRRDMGVRARERVMCMYSASERTADIQDIILQVFESDLSSFPVSEKKP